MDEETLNKIVDHTMNVLVGLVAAFAIITLPILILAFIESFIISFFVVAITVMMYALGKMLRENSDEIIETLMR